MNPERRAVDEEIKQGLIREFYARWGIVLDKEGRMQSQKPCWCGNGDVWLKSRTKPSSWKHDVYITTFTYTCKNCGVTWNEHDSD